MSLTGWPLLTLVCILFVVFTVGAIGELPMLKAPRVLKRTVTVIGSQLCAVLIALLALNNWGQFYGSWSDLFGGSSDDVTTVNNTDGKPVAAGLPASMGLTGWSTKDELSTKGGVFSLDIAGARTHLSTKALVFLPPQYFQKGHEKDRFPVVETIAGYPGDVPQLVDHLGYPDAQNKAVENGTGRPMILVMMKPSPVPGRDTECVDIPHGPQVLSFFSKDVPAVLHRELRTTQSGWGAMGHSTGGYCAAKLAMTDPSQFSTAVSLSGSFSAEDDSTTGDLFGGQEKVRHENDLTWRLKNMPVPDVAILASMGSAEKGADGVAGAKEFMAAVKPPLVAQLKLVSGGGHNFRTYQVVLPDAFAWLKNHVRG